MSSSSTSNSDPIEAQIADERDLKAAELAWDLVIQLAKLREQRGLTQSQLADLVGTSQQAVSRLENPLYDRHSLRVLREIVKALNAFVDVVVVPEEHVDAYLARRYQPVLDDQPPASLAPDADMSLAETRKASLT
ncbi:MAG: helix-turn-helix transcriptional regulator [Chloroflexi bacterium]|nr:helix-turn-helix transcriptional regulator [Chloroflexota bacterium]